MGANDCNTKLVLYLVTTEPSIVNRNQKKYIIEF